MTGRTQRYHRRELKLQELKEKIVQTFRKNKLRKGREVLGIYNEEKGS